MNGQECIPSLMKKLYFNQWKVISVFETSIKRIKDIHFRILEILYNMQFGCTSTQKIFQKIKITFSYYC